MQTASLAPLPKRGPVWLSHSAVLRRHCNVGSQFTTVKEHNNGETSWFHRVERIKPVQIGLGIGIGTTLMLGWMDYKIGLFGECSSTDGTKNDLDGEKRPSIKDSPMGGAIEEEVRAMRKEHADLLRRVQDLEQCSIERKAQITEQNEMIERLKKDNDRLIQDMGEEVRKREELVRSTVEPKKKPRVSDQYSREYVRQMAEREGLSMMEHSKIDGLIAAKMREWEGNAERDGDGTPMFVNKMEQYAYFTKDPWDAIQAQYLYLNRRHVSANWEEYEYGNNTLHYCAKYESLSPMLQWLLEDGNISPTKTDMTLKQTPLHTAALNNNVKGATVLLNDERVDRNATDDNGDTPLIFATKWKRPPMVSLLLQRGCEKSIQNQRGDTALMIAEERGYTELIRLLKE